MNAETTVVKDKVDSDDPFTAKMRKKQSDWRKSQNLQAGARPGIKADVILGNLIEDGEQNGRNFYFKETFEYAKWRVRTKLPVETIEANRLFNNLLSSQPMAFNLFHPLMMLKNENPEAVDAIIKKAFPGCKELHRVTEIGLEFIPTPKENYTNDLSAMDAFIRFQDKKGENYLIAIETKYTDHLGTNVASKNGIERQKAIIEELGMFEQEFPITQVFRNFLLAEKYGRVHGLRKVYSVIVAPRDHPTTGDEMRPLLHSLKIEHRNRVMAVSLESLIEALFLCGDARYLHWAEWLQERYV